jgi:S1-C subfamily serine protease
VFGYGLTDGLLVAGVDEDGPLAQAGLAKGDLVAGINGQRLHDLARATLTVSELGASQEVNLLVIGRRQRGNYNLLQQGEVRVKLR